MRLSLYEIQTILRKAVIGAGFPVGLAEECGRAGAWLAASGQDGVGSVLMAIRGGKRAPVTPVAEGNRLIFPETSVALTGPSVIDLLVGVDVDDIQLRLVDAPLLMIGMAGVAAADYGREFILVSDGNIFAEVSPSGLTLNGDTPPPGGQMGIKCQVATAVAGEALPVRSREGTDGAIVDAKLWHEALALAFNTYVPASDVSRVAGAGAGLTDND